MMMPDKTLALRNFLRTVQLATDQEVWMMACLMVGIVGRRAMVADETFIEKACIDFCRAMHQATNGLTPVPPQGRFEEIKL